MLLKHLAEKLDPASFFKWIFPTRFISPPVISWNSTFSNNRRKLTLPLRESVHIRSYSGPYFPGFGLNTERYSRISPYSIRIRENTDRITPNTDTFHAELTNKLN